MSYFQSHCSIKPYRKQNFQVLKSNLNFVVRLWGTGCKSGGMLSPHPGGTVREYKIIVVSLMTLSTSALTTVTHCIIINCCRMGPSRFLCIVTLSLTAVIIILPTPSDAYMSSLPGEFGRDYLLNVTCTTPVSILYNQSHRQVIMHFAVSDVFEFCCFPVAVY